MPEGIQSAKAWNQSHAKLTQLRQSKAEAVGTFNAAREAYRASGGVHQMRIEER